MRLWLQAEVKDKSEKIEKTDELAQNNKEK
jgi:hypothetical protein